MSNKNPRFPEICEMTLGIPLSLMELDKADIVEFGAFAEDYLLRHFSPAFRELSESYRNDNKEVRSKGELTVCPTNEVVCRRSGSRIVGDKWNLLLFCRFPLLGVAHLNGKMSARMVGDIMQTIENSAATFDRDRFAAQKEIYGRQMFIRAHLRRVDAVCFIADGSVLPRKGGTSEPLETAVKFVSPPNLAEEIVFPDGAKIRGMLIKIGVTVITGGGFSGKSTLMDSIERGIYNHIPGDGREYVITDDTAMKTSAEDGRPVSGLDISPFFSFFPSCADVRNFSTDHASGSVSQAANIIEAAALGARVLLIDEDESATNLLIRDKNMRQIIKSEPIIPFTDRIDDLRRNSGVSIVLVVGCSSDYLKYADSVILMENYTAHDISADIKSRDWTHERTCAESAATWTRGRSFAPLDNYMAFVYFRTVATENAKKIILDKYVADITLLTALISQSQLNTLAAAMERMLSVGTPQRAKNAQSETKSPNLTSAAGIPTRSRELDFRKTGGASVDTSIDIAESAAKIAEQIMAAGENGESVSMTNFKSSRFYDEVRPIDIAACLCRMRNVSLG